MKNRTCGVCGKLKNCRYRVQNAAACQKCHRINRYIRERCPRCRRMKFLEARDAQGHLICMACRKKYVQERKPCRTCGKLDVLSRNLCKRHYDALLRATRPEGTCIDCGRKRPLRRGRCATCEDTRTARVRVDKVLRQLLGQRGRIRQPQLQKLFAHLTRERRPLTVERWLRRLAPEVRAYLHRARDGVVTQADLVQLRAFSGGAQLLSSCRRAGLFLDAALDVMDAYVAQLLEHATSANAVILRQYWQCYIRPQIDERVWIYRRTDPALRFDRTRLRIAADFLAYVVEQHWELVELSDDRIRHYVAARPRAYPDYVAAFCRWLRGSGRVRRPINGPAEHVRHDRRCTPNELGCTLYRACSDELLPLDVRVALIFVILARQPLHRCVALERRALSERGGDVLAVQFVEGPTWRFRGTPAGLIRALAGRGRRWLFPGRCGRAMTAVGLARRIARAGIATRLSDLRMSAIDKLEQYCDPAEAVRAVGVSATRVSAWRQRHDGPTLEARARLARTRKRRISRGAAVPRRDRAATADWS